MEHKLHLNEKLEKQKLNDLFNERSVIDSENKEQRMELLNRIIGELVMNTSFLSPVTVEDAEGGDKNITFNLIRSPENTKYLPIFTSTEDLQLMESAENKQYARFIFDDYAGLLAANSEIAGFVVNPFSDNFKVDKALAASWLENKQLLVDGHTSHRITKDTEYEFYAPTPYPHELSENLADEAKNHAEVNRIWLRGIKLEGAEGYIAVVELDGSANREPAFIALGERAKQYLEGLPIHFVQYAPGFGEEAVGDVLPIYTKAK